MKKKIKNGFSLIEMLLVLGVLSVLLIAAFVIYPKIQQSSKVSGEVNNLTIIKVGVANFLESTSVGYNALGGGKDGNIMLNQARIIPEKMNGGNYNTAELRHSWGGEVSIVTTYYSHEGYSAGKTFMIRYLNIPSDVCVELLPQVYGVFPKIKVGDDDTVLTEGNLSIDKLTQSCNSSPLVNLAFIAQ